MVFTPRIRPILMLLLVAGAAQAAQPHPTNPAQGAITFQSPLALVHLAEAQRVMSGPGLEQADAAYLSGQMDGEGQMHSRFQQRHGGVKVWGGQVVTHQHKDGSFLPATDRLFRNISVSTVPTLGTSEALAVAHHVMRPNGALPEPPTCELVVVPVLAKVEVPMTHPEGGLNARDVRYRADGYRLAYHVSMQVGSAVDPLGQKDFLIDAHGGEVLKQWDSLEAAGATGVGKSEYSGTVPVDSTPKAAGGFDLIDGTRAKLVHPYTGLLGNATYDAGMASIGYASTGTLYTDADNTWGDGANFVAASGSSSANGQTAAVDAHYGMAATWDFYKNVLGRDGIDNLGTSTHSRVHFQAGYVNAFWSDSCFCMTYGDGNLASGIGVLTSLDIAGHEMSHGVSSRTAGLIYADEMGGLNESNSDIFGEMVSFYAHGAQLQGSVVPNVGGSWIMGHQLSSTDGLSRWFVKPSKDGVSQDAWFPTLGLLDVHYSSGPNNRMFYFLSNGASATSTDDAYSPYLKAGMKGVGNDHATKIWYRALSTYMTPYTRYFDARRAAVRAATDLYGAASPEYKAVQDAYAAINVGVPSSAGPEDLTAPVIGSVTITGQSGTIFLSSAVTDDHEVASVDYYIDDFYVGTGTGLDFRIPFDSRTMANGTHTVTAIAFDTNQNESKPSSGVTYVASNDRFQGILNPSFEWGTEGWSVDSPDFAWLSTKGRPGSLYAMGLGGAGVAATGHFHQDLVLPADSNSLKLSYWWWVNSSKPTTTVTDTFKVRLLDAGGTELAVLGTHTNQDTKPSQTTGYTLNTVDVTPYLGRTVRLQVEGSEGPGDILSTPQLFTAIRFDDFALVGTRVDPLGKLDINQDGMVDGIDLGLLMLKWGTATSTCDLNSDGVVNSLDLALLLNSFGK